VRSERFEMKVLIVDDSKIVCNGLQKMLTGIPGVKISGQAFNGKDAITSISKLKPDVVILDIRLPDLSGIDVLIDIREKNLPTRVIMLTNYPYPQYRKKCEELGADYFFDKVTEIDELPDLIKELAKNDKAKGKQDA
jgi:DNA-binding NarL/FixJ family response regulator